MLISAYETPKNLNQQIFSKEVYIAAIIGFDMLENLENSQSYGYKYFKYDTGKDLIKSQLIEAATELVEKQDYSLIPKYLNIIQTLKNPALKEYIKYIDKLSDGILNAGDILTFSFDEPIQEIFIDDLVLTNKKHTFGTNARIEAVDIDENGYATTFNVILGDDVHLTNGDKITINKIKIIDKDGIHPKINIKLSIKDIIDENNSNLSENQA